MAIYTIPLELCELIGRRYQTQRYITLRCGIRSY